jgi:thymidylate kinase
LIIEFCGHRAAGKTTLARDVAHILRRRGFEVHQHNLQPRGEKLPVTKRDAVRLLAARPSLTRLVLKTDVRRSDLTRLFLRDLHARHLRTDVAIHLVEESVTHLLPHYTKAWDERTTAAIMVRLRPPDLAVRVVCDPEEAVRRAKHRGRDPVDLSPELIRATIAGLTPNLGVIDDYTRVIDIDTTNVGDHADQVASEIVRLREAKCAGP